MIKMEVVNDLDKTGEIFFRGANIFEDEKYCKTSLMRENYNENGDYRYSNVWKFELEDGDLYVEFYGHRVLYDDACYEGFREVLPRQKKLTTWR